ncbi:MAG TPA: adenylosuccinate synthetase, partial [Thermomicrobiales bacterium]|nr:adenylosuccinate synthetase [Thermomicrobiales bacterium]
FDEIKIATGYKTPSGDLTHVPALLDRLEDATAVWESLPGWNSDTTSARSWGELPDAAIKYLDRLQQQIGAPVRYVGVGPAREQLIDRNA